MKYRSHIYKIILGKDNDIRNVPKYASICSQSSSNILHYYGKYDFTLTPLIFPYKISGIPSCMAKTVFWNWSIRLKCIKNQILSICSAAAKWKRKFSVAGGNRFCFRASEFRVGFSLLSEASVSEAKVARISFVFREISLKNRKSSNDVRNCNVLMYAY